MEKRWTKVGPNLIDVNPVLNQRPVFFDEINVYVPDKQDKNTTV